MSDVQSACESKFGLQSSEEVVHELLSELLTSVCSEEWASLSPRVCTLPSSPGITSAVDVCEVVRQHTPFHVLCGYCDRERGWEVLQLQCVDQKASGYCGHYSLYLTMLCLQLCQCSCRDNTLALLHGTRSTVGFWQRYWVSIGLLLEQVRAHPEELWWPWTQQHVLHGEMERSYLSYLLTSDPSIRAVGGCQRISVVHIAYGCVQNHTDDVIKFQQTIERLRTRRSPHGHVFILGVTNHWLTLYAYHRNQSAEQHPMSKREGLALVYLDSNNVPVLGASDEEIDDIVVEREKKKVQKKGQGYSSWKRDVIKQAFCDQRDLVTLLARCLSGQQSLLQHVLCRHWSVVLDSFEQHVAAGAVVGVDMFLPLLIQWLENHHQPNSLRDHQVCMLRDFGAGYLNKVVRVRLTGWLDYSQERLGDYHGGIDLVDVFMSVLQHIRQLIG